MRLPVSRMFQRTILASSSLNTPATRSLSYLGSGAFGEIVRHHLGLGGVDRVVTLHLVGDRVGGAQVRSRRGRAFPFRAPALSIDRELARLLGGLLGELDDRLDHRLEVPVAEHHGAEHDVFGQLLGLRLDHQHGVLRAGDDEIELAFGHLSSVGLRTYSLLMKPTRAAPIGPMNGAPDSVSAAEEATSARMSGSFSRSCDSVVTITCVSLRQPSANSGRIGRSIRRETSVSFSVGRPSRLK